MEASMEVNSMEVDMYFLGNKRNNQVNVEDRTYLATRRHHRLTSTSDIIREVRAV